jgi:hypothetical protein
VGPLFLLFFFKIIPTFFSSKDAAALFSRSFWQAFVVCGHRRAPQTPHACAPDHPRCEAPRHDCARKRAEDDAGESLKQEMTRNILPLPIRETEKKGKPCADGSLVGVALWLCPLWPLILSALEQAAPLNSRLP